MGHGISNKFFKRVLVVLVVPKGRPVGSAGRVRLWAERPGRPLRSGRRRTAVSRGVSALP